MTRRTTRVLEWVARLLACIGILILAWVGLLFLFSL